MFRLIIVFMALSRAGGLHLSDRNEKIHLLPEGS